MLGQKKKWEQDAQSSRKLSNVRQSEYSQKSAVQRFTGPVNVDKERGGGGDYAQLEIRQRNLKDEIKMRGSQIGQFSRVTRGESPSIPRAQLTAHKLVKAELRLDHGRCRKSKGECGPETIKKLRPPTSWE